MLQIFSKGDFNPVSVAFVRHGRLHGRYVDARRVYQVGLIVQLQLSAIEPLGVTHCLSSALTRARAPSAIRVGTRQALTTRLERLARAHPQLEQLIGAAQHEQVGLAFAAAARGL